MKPSDDSIVEARKREREKEKEKEKEKEQPAGIQNDDRSVVEDVGEVVEVLADARGTTDSTSADTIKNMTQDTIDRILDAKKSSSVGEKSHLSLRRASPRTAARGDDP
ncbi:hypothetical protein N9L68_01960 [bacterium]|nr:hypothetical protein [bacterium]